MCVQEGRDFKLFILSKYDIVLIIVYRQGHYNGALITVKHRRTIATLIQITHWMAAAGGWVDK